MTVTFARLRYVLDALAMPEEQSPPANQALASQPEVGECKKCKEYECQLDAWFSVFGTTQLSHAQARLEQAEETASILVAKTGGEPPLRTLEERRKIAEQLQKMVALDGGDYLVMADWIIAHFARPDEQSEKERHDPT